MFWPKMTVLKCIKYYSFRETTVPVIVIIIIIIIITTIIRLRPSVRFTA
jgi:hypothetical protein